MLSDKYEHCGSKYGAKRRIACVYIVLQTNWRGWALNDIME